METVNEWAAVLRLFSISGVRPRSSTRCSPLRWRGTVSPPGCELRPSSTAGRPRPWGSTQHSRDRPRGSRGVGGLLPLHWEGVRRVRPGPGHTVRGSWSRRSCVAGRPVRARRGITPVDECMSSKHREFLGWEYLRHIAPSAALQPVHALIMRATRLPGHLIADLASASLRSDLFVSKQLAWGRCFELVRLSPVLMAVGVRARPPLFVGVVTQLDTQCRPLSGGRN